MSHQFLCNCCGGTYTDVMPDGMIYNHVCGPIEDKKTRQFIPRPDFRDENIDTNRRGDVLGIVSEGLGVKCVTSDLLQEPPWITRLKSNIDEQEE